MVFHFEVHSEGCAFAELFSGGFFHLGERRAMTQWVHWREEGPFPLLVLMGKAELVNVVLSCVCMAKEVLKFMLNKAGLRPNDLVKSMLHRTWSWVSSGPYCAANGDIRTEPSSFVSSSVVP